MSHSALSQSFVLHTRPFKESSLILELLTLEEGRCSVLARGVRGAKKSSKRALLQPFQPLALSWVGRSDLKTLKQVEPLGPSIALSGIPSLSGLYMNELLLKLLIQWDPHPDIYDAYQRALYRLQSEPSPAVVLREFELGILDDLGYGIDWACDIQGDIINEQLDYGFIPEQGFVLIGQAPKSALKIKGKNILAVANRQWQTSGSLSTARKISRAVIDPLIGFKELHSRKLLQQTLAIQG
ncbi:DNA repair protein RecO [Kangiella sediminilitoris]|uniref:DNA repair protein RecO n=1 Tax=Kangiella sediminilitoris TaxID=1144748 RepID=A0A1B3BCB4_9GAMM|nr:DNA repair protein RecO [Kangiella sediminilitoris]AOE50395.1 DNA repair protein RecO [Kangiella sediminilitoris]